MASITCRIDGVASSAYMKSGSAVGTVPTLSKKYDGTYQITVTTDFTAWQSFYVSAYTSYGDDAFVSISVESGNASAWDDSFDVGGAFVGTIVVSSEAEYIYIQPSDPYSPSDISFSFNGATGPYGDGTGNYRWNISSTYPTLTTPSAPTLRQNNDGTYTASWNGSSLSGATATVYYVLWDATNGGLIQDGITGTSVTRDIASYNTTLRYRIGAYYGNSSYWSASAEAWSGSTSAAFTQPSISTPTGVSINPTEGEATTISWNASSLNATA